MTRMYTRLVMGFVFISVPFRIIAQLFELMEYGVHFRKMLLYVLLTLYHLGFVLYSFNRFYSLYYYR